MNNEKREQARVLNSLCAQLEYAIKQRTDEDDSLNPDAIMLSTLVDGRDVRCIRAGAAALLREAEAAERAPCSVPRSDNQGPDCTQEQPPIVEQAEVAAAPDVSEAELYFNCIWRGWGVWVTSPNSSVESWEYITRESISKRSEQIVILPAANYDALTQALESAKADLREINEAFNDNEGHNAACRIKKLQEALAEAERERDAAHANYREEYQIVARIWEIFGSPEYRTLQGKSIYDLIRETVAERDTLRAELASARAKLAHWKNTAETFQDKAARYDGLCD